MADEQPSGVFDPERIVRTLDRHGVDYVLIGGVAARLHRFTHPDRGRRLSIDRVGLALVPTQPPVGSLDLDHDHPAGRQPAAQSRAVAAGAFDSDLVDRAELRRPAQLSSAE